MEAYLRVLWHDSRLTYRSFPQGGCFTTRGCPNGEVGFPGTRVHTSLIKTFDCLGELVSELWTPGIAVMNMKGPLQPLYSAWWLYALAPSYTSHKLKKK